MDILLNGLHILRVFLGGVRVVKTQIAESAKVLCGAEIDGQCLAVADVEISVRLRRETGMHLHAFKLSARGEIVDDKVFNEVSSGFFHSSESSL